VTHYCVDTTEYYMYLYVSTITGSERKAAHRSSEGTHTLTHKAAENTLEYLLTHSYFVSPTDDLVILPGGWVENLCKKSAVNVFSHAMILKSK